MKQLGKSLLIFTYTSSVGLFGVFVLQTGFNDFVAKYFNLQQMSYWMALGFSIFLGLLRNKLLRSKEKSDEETVKLVNQILGVYIVALLFMWLAKFMM